MTGFCWRLLAAFSLILVGAFVRGQDAADRLPILLPSAPNAATRYSLPIEREGPPLPYIPPRAYIPLRGAPLNSRTPAFEQIARVAGIIFSGRVILIGPSAGFSRHETASTTVTFQVEQAMRGVTAGQNLTIREWAGLWSAGERYRVGERVLLFLYSPSKLGLTSPVLGGMGRFAMDSRGMIVMSPQHIAALSAHPILGGKTVVHYADFARAVERSGWEE